MLKKMKALFAEEEGQGMTEYGLIIGLVAVVVVVALVALRDQISALFKSVSDAVTKNTPAG